MKLALISDTHSQMPQLSLFEGADAVIHAGDIGPDHNVEEWVLTKFAHWYHKLTQQMGIPFYGTFGNHDFPEKWPLRDLILADQLAQIGPHKVWFSPWSPTFGDCAWMLSEPELMQRYNRIPPDTNIIVSYSPPYQVCDRTLRGEPVGSKALRVRMLELPDLKYVICGHIHEARGRARLGQIEVMNVASVNEYYEPLNEPITWLEL